MCAMKSDYFTSKLINTQAEELLSDLKLKHRRSIVWEKPALLVLDMQQYFLDPNSHAFVPSAPALIPGISQLVQGFREKGYPVIFTQHINTPGNAGMMSNWWRDLITSDHPLADLTNKLEVGDSPVIEKSQYDAFLSTDLEMRLKEWVVTDVVITGVMTHLCCETTARSAFMHGYQVWFAVDGTATYHLDFHKSTLINLSHGFATPVLVRELLAAL
jgi:bifunctional isochorismate lyase/aryl carrier protein